MADVDICNRALAAIGSRAIINSLSSEDSEEAKTCNMLFASLRDQILGMANWNFARKTAALNLVKAAPGTPVSPVTNATQWISSYPAPPWMYEYAIPSDSVKIRYIIPQPGVYNTGVPIFSTPQYTFDGYLGSPPQRFIIATDNVGPTKAITGITQANPAVVSSAAHGFNNGDSIYLTTIVGMAELNGTLAVVANTAANTYELSGVDTTAFQAYSSGGVAVNQTQTTVQQNVVLTDAMGAIGIYTQKITNIDLWGAQAVQALESALAGFIAMPLTGDKLLRNLLLKQANDHIIQARATDGNEGLTIQESIPDWILARGYDAELQSSGFYTAPFSPLFAVS